MKSYLVAGTILFSSITAAAAQGSYDALPVASMLPEDVVQLSGVVPQMGEHWGKIDNLPLGPIYCVHENKIVCLEFMISQEDFAAGESWPVLAGMDGLPPVNHVSISFEPEGHEGYEIPHYDIHMFFLTPEEVAEIE